MYIIQVDWVKGLRTSILTFDWAWFFPSLNHYLLLLTLARARLDDNIVGLFSDYLIGRYMQYIWNNFTSPSFQTNIRVEQGSFLSPILLALYLAPVLRIWEKRINNLNIPIPASILSFIDNDLVTVVLWTSSYILYGLLLYQKSDVGKATC